MEHISRRTFLAASVPALSAQSTRPIRVAIVGTGHRAWGHIAVLKTIPGYEIAALADPTPEFLDRAATLAPGAARYSDYRKLLAERKDLDAVIVITPNFLHAEVTIAALEHGLDVLCEKPMATSVEDANRMAAAAGKAGKILYIGCQKRFSPAHLKMQELAAAGALGKIQFVSANLFRGDWNPRSWKYTDPKTGVSTNWRYLTRTEGSALLEDGIHEMDTLNWIINARVKRVAATGGNNVYKDRETIDHAGLLIEYETGVKLSFDFCLFGQNAGPTGRRMVLIGDAATMQPENGKVSIRKHGGGAAEYFELKSPEPRASEDSETHRQYLAFAESVRTRKPPFVGPEAGKTAIKIMLLAEKSLREHRVMDWNDLPA